MTKKKTYYTSLKAACSGHEEDHIYLAAVLHQMPDPIADQVSYVLDVHVTKKGLSIRPVFNGRDLIADHYSGFNCIVRDPVDSLYVGEDDGVIRYRNGTSEVFRLTKSIKLEGLVNSAYVLGANDIVFGSSSGTLVRLRGDEFSLIKIPRTPADASLDRFHGIGTNFIVGVGDEGFVVCFRNEKWERIKSPTDSRLMASWCRSESEVYIGGKFGRAWCWDGAGRWKPLKTLYQGDLQDFWYGDFVEFQGTIFAACYEQGIYRLDGDRFVPVPKVANEYVSKLEVTNVGLVGLGEVWGESGSWFTRFDGQQWTAEKINFQP